MQTQLAALVLASLSTTATAELATSEAWVADFDEAAALAKEQGKDMLVDFTGSDWCGWCIKLDEEVFEHEEFLTGVQNDFVLVKLDYPRGEEAKAKVPDPERNQELVETYGVRGYPTILLMTADGEVFGKTGYQRGGPEPYVEHLTKLREDGKKELSAAKELIEAFTAAEGDAKFEALEKIIAKFESLDGESFFVGQYAKPIKEGLDLDANDERGLRTRGVKALVKKGQVDAQLLDVVRAMDPSNEAGLLSMAITGLFENVTSEDDVHLFVKTLSEFEEFGDLSDYEDSLNLYATGAYWASKLVEDDEAAKKFAVKAKAILDGDTSDQRLVDMLDEILEG